MEKSFIKDMKSEIKKCTVYKKPFVILTSGMDGCGKMEFSREASRKLKIFFLANDCLRNYYWSKAKPYNEKNIDGSEEDYLEKQRLNVERLAKIAKISRISNLLIYRTSFVWGRNVYSSKQYDKLTKIFKLFGYNIINIKFNSTDEINMENISKRKMDYDNIDNTVLGDNMQFSSYYPEKAYFEIKERQCTNLGDVEFDYTINNNDNKKELGNQIDNVVSDISAKARVKRNN